jgi:hypothetical protein
MLEDLSRIRYVDRQKDEIPVHEGAEYICLMKLFPMCGHDGVVSDENYRRFHLRFYIPREYFNDARKKIDRILIMTNGLDEFDKYLLYDQLGSNFASLGLAAVLLPLPDHLNRHIRYRLKDPPLEKIKAKPSEELKKNPLVLHDRFLQCKEELARLRDHINWKPFEGTSADPCKDRHGHCSFYSHFFADEVRVSYLGYSLGGATMLCDFLDSEKSLNACFLLNPAIKLPAVEGGKMFGEEDWKEFIPRLMSTFRDYHETDKLFEEIVLGEWIHDTRRLLQEHGRRLLFIFGGSDDFTKYTNSQPIMPEQWGSGMLIIPGIKHLVAESEEWKKWRTLMVKLISDFEENAARRVITEEELDKIREEANLDISERERRERDEELYRAKLLGTIDRMDERKDDRQKVRALRKGNIPLAELRLGEMLFKKGYIKFDGLWDALEEQHRCGLRDAPEEQRMSRMRIGDILVDVFRLVTREQVEELASIQRRPKDEA